MILTAPLSLKIHSNHRNFADELIKTRPAAELTDKLSLFSRLDAEKKSLMRLNKIHDMLSTIIVNALIVGTTAVAAHFFGAMILSKGLSLLASAGIVQSDTDILANLPGGAGLAAHICFTFPVLAISLCAIVAGLLNVRCHYKMLERGDSKHSMPTVIVQQWLRKQIPPDYLALAESQGKVFPRMSIKFNGFVGSSATIGIVEYPGGMDSASLFRHSSHIFRGAELLINLPMSVPVSLCNAVLSCCNNRALQAGD